MAVEKYTALANITLGSSAASVTFGSIPSGYRDLRIVFTAATSANSNNIMQFNGDTGTNYSGVWAGGTGTTTTSGTYNTTFMGTDSSSFTTPTLGDTTHLLQIMDYSATDKHKTVLIRGSRAAGRAEMIAARWANTSAITTILLKPNNGSYTWLAGSTFELYGVA